MSINWKKTADLNNTDIKDIKEYFDKYPKSHKNIIAICDNRECGVERKINFSAYRNLCSVCSHRTEEYREKNSDRTSQWWKNHPEKKSERSESSIRWWANHPEEKTKTAARTTRWFKDNPEKVKLKGEKQSQWCDDHPEVMEILNINKSYRFSGKNNPMYGITGGNDLVNHHYIYDHDDLSCNTVKMTRSDHTSLHNLFRKLGYKTPHINQDVII